MWNKSLLGGYGRCSWCAVFPCPFASRINLVAPLTFWGSLPHAREDSQNTTMTGSIFIVRKRTYYSPEKSLVSVLFFLKGSLLPYTSFLQTQGGFYFRSLHCLQLERTVCLIHGEHFAGRLRQAISEIRHSANHRWCIRIGKCFQWFSDTFSKKQIVLEASNMVYVKEPGEFKQYGIHFEKVKRRLEKCVNDELETSEEGQIFKESARHLPKNCAFI